MSEDNEDNAISADDVKAVLLAAIVARQTPAEVGNEPADTNVEPPKPRAINPLKAAGDSILDLLEEVSQPKANVKKFREGIKPHLRVIGESGVVCAKLAEKIKADKADKAEFFPQHIVHALNGLATYGTDKGKALYADGKLADYVQLSQLTRKFVDGDIYWSQVVPVEKVKPVDTEKEAKADPEPKPTPKATVVEEDDKDDKDVASKPFDVEDEGNQLDDEAITGFELITIDPADSLSHLDDDWFSKSCGDIVAELDKEIALLTGPDPFDVPA